jgi:cytoskeletal protein CcmA (bactofilin family)
MKLSKALIVTGMVFGMGMSSIVSADDVYCPENLGAVTIDGNVIVDGDCRMDRTTVKGNVHVYDGGALTVVHGDIDGNIQADGGHYVRVLHTRVGGDIQLEGISAELSGAYKSKVDGNIQLDANNVELWVKDTTIGGDLQAFSNRGGVVVRYNTIDGNLQCKENRPEPTGGSNWVSGNKEDQCKRL